MNRRAFLGAVVGTATFGYMASGANAGAKFGHNAPPDGFPEYNWIDFEEDITGISPTRGDHIVVGHRAIYLVSGVHGPFTITRGNRLWAMHIQPEMARVQVLQRR